MKKLISGLREFQTGYYSTHQELFEQLSHGQKPRVLFIACSDARVDPNLITQAQVGELFVIRNAGNIIPPFGATNGGEGAAVEYAVHALGIDQIIVCGHSRCGAMSGLLKLDKLEKEMPLVYDWLKHAEATRRLIMENYGDREGEELLDITTAENVLTQIENLRTYPVIHSKLHQHKLKIFGWVYHIETGAIMTYDPKQHSFVAPHSELPSFPAEEDETPESLQFYASVHIRERAEPPQPPVQPDPARQTQPISRKMPFPTAHLSPEQADRIYRGSNR